MVKTSLEMPLSADDRREAKLQQLQANEQITLLERGSNSGISDFYTYRLPLPGN
jgi:hypothetical protein